MLNFLMSSLFYLFITLCLILNISYERVDDNIKPYYNEFNNIIKETCPTLKVNNPHIKVMRIGDLPTGFIGLCQLQPNGFILTIDRQYWDKMNSDDRAITYFHEATHCVLLLNHSNNPDNYMYPSDIKVLTKQNVIEQVKENIKRKCNNASN